jgi:tetratricopeptide (TPR) repeat protein
LDADDRIERSRLLYERALFDGDGDALAVAERELDAVEADLTLARGRVIHGRFLERRTEDPDQAGDKKTMSEALRHLGIAEHRAGRLDAARQRLEESTRLRQEIGSLPGVAANLVGLTYIAAGQGRRADALALIEKAATIAEASGAHGIMRQGEEARAQL